MLTLKELKKVVKVADMEADIPSAKVLKESGAEIVTKEILDTDTTIAVYENGYVLYQEGAKTTVFPLHKCGEYEYENIDGTRKRVKGEFFDNENEYKFYMETILIRYISNYLSNEVVEIEELMEIKQLIQRQKIERMMKVHKEMRGLDRYREQPKEYKYHNPYDDWIFRQLADIDNRKNIPNISPQVDFNEGDYEDYLKAKWNRGL